MPMLSDLSKNKLGSCCQELQTLFNEVIRSQDFTVVCGFRNKESQHKAFLDKKSKTDWPNSKHNSLPSMAVDVAPYPLDWNNKKRFIFFAGYVFAIFNQLKSVGSIKDCNLRWGGNWDGAIVKDQSFDDLPHFEIVRTGE